MWHDLQHPIITFYPLFRLKLFLFVKYKVWAVISVTWCLYYFSIFGHLHQCSWHAKFTKVYSKFCQIQKYRQKLPKTCCILPKRRNFAKSGHTCWHAVESTADFMRLKTWWYRCTFKAVVCEVMEFETHKNIPSPYADCSQIIKCLNVGRVMGVENQLFCYYKSKETSQKKKVSLIRWAQEQCDQKKSPNV